MFPTRALQFRGRPYPLEGRRVLLWLNPTFLGDAVLTTPLIESLIELKAEVVVYAGPAILQLYGHLVDRVSLVEARPARTVRGSLAEAKFVRSLRPDVVFVLKRSFRSAAYARLVRADMRVGHATEGRGFLLDRSIRPDLEIFEADSVSELLKLLGHPVPITKPSLSVSDAEREEVRPILSGARVGLQPGGRFSGKRPAPEMSARIVEHLAEKGIGVALFGAMGERKSVDALQEHTSVPSVDLVGELSLRQSMAALSQMDLFVSGDTGLAHIAAALGVPTLQLFGKTPVGRWGWKGPRNRVLVAPGREMNTFEPATVLAAIDELLSAR